MEPAYYFLDPAFLCTSNVEEYRNSKHLEIFTHFYNRIKEIDRKLFPEGHKDSFFKIPFDMDLIYNCQSNPPSTDPELSRLFYKTFNIISGRHIIECNINLDIDVLEEIYTNSGIPIKILSDFNEFLELCRSNRNSDCICKNIITPTPILLSSNTNFNDTTNFTPFTNPDNIYHHIPLLKLFPQNDDSIEIKGRKLRLIFEIGIIKRGFDVITIVNNYCSHSIDELIIKNDPLDKIISFQNEFWDCDLLYLDDDRFKLRVIEVLTELLITPESLNNRRHILEHEFIYINGVKKRLDQIYIFQSYKIGGCMIYPRIRFKILNNKLYLKEIIDPH